jgi:hypothetical protein
MRVSREPRLDKIRIVVLLGKHGDIHTDAIAVGKKRAVLGCRGDEVVDELYSGFCGPCSGVCAIC